ncbi:MAG: hypothetical protein J6Y28_09110 [Acholeplasmatales bacterium]|nr:hypothetical protein [Acholeplasmatales bacterium]
MLKLAKNKKGVSMTEIIAAIVIIGLSSTTLTSMVITSYRGQLRAQEYVLAEEMAKTYDSMLSRDIKRANLKTIEAIRFKNQDDSTEKFVVVDESLLQDMTKISDTEDSPTYLSLYSQSTTDHFQLNDNYYDATNVNIQIYMINADFGYYKTKVTISYSNDRQVTYNGTHFSE